MSILPVSGLGSLAGVTGAPASLGTALAVRPAAALAEQDASRAAVVGAATGTSATTFASVLSSVDQVQQLQATSSELAVRAVTGDLDDVHDYTVAASQASLALELTAAVRNKAVDAFTEILRMQA